MTPTSIREHAARWLDRAVYPLLALLVLAPGFVFPRAVQESIKVGNELIIVVLAWGLVAVVGGSRALAGKPFLGGGEGSPVRLVLAGFLAWLVVAGWLSPSATIHWMYAATVVAYLLVGQSVLGWLEERPERRNAVYVLLALAVGHQVLLAGLQFARVPLGALRPFVPPDGWLDGYLSIAGNATTSGVPTGTTGNPNYLAELLSLTGPVLGAWALTRRDRGTRAVLGSLAGGIAFAVVACSSRATVLGLAIGAAVAMGMSGAWRAVDVRGIWRDRRKRRLLLGALLIAIAIGGVAGGRISSKLSRDLAGDSSFQSRVTNWRVGVDVWLARPIQGHGLGGWKRSSVEALATRFPDGLPAHTASNRFVQLHNEPLQLLVELGLVGFSLLLAAFVLWCREVARNDTLALPERVGLLWGFVALLVAAGFGFPFHIAPTALAAVLLMAVGVARRSSTEGASSPLLAAPWRLPYAVGVVGLVGFVGWTAASRTIVPIYHASHYYYLGVQAQRHDPRGEGPAVLFAHAAELDRFKPRPVFKQLEVLLAAKRYEEVLRVYDRYRSEGLSMASRLQRGRALAALGRRDEAIAEFQAVAHFYDVSHANYRVAHTQLRSVGVTIPAPVPKRARGRKPELGPTRPSKASPAGAAPTQVDNEE